MKTGLLGIDIGTTTTKAVLFDLHGTELACAASAPYRNKTPHPGWIEQNPEAIWQAVLIIIRNIMDQVTTDVQVSAVCIAAQSGSLLPANSDGEPVYPVITWMDGRTEELVTNWKTLGIQERVKPLSGWSLYPGLPLPTIAWIRENDPQTFSEAEHYFSVNDFIAHRLTGERVTNPSNGGGMQLVDIRTSEWSSDLCALAGISPTQLSNIEPSGSVVGLIKSEICSETGLTPGVVLINGGHDQVITALGLGITDSGKLLLACGTAWVFTGVTTYADMTRIPDSLDMNFYILPQHWTVSQSLGGLGASLEWWLKQAWSGNHKDRLIALDQALAETIPSTELFFIPITGGHDDPSTSRSGGFVGVQLSCRRDHFARAIMESAGFELRLALEKLERAQMPVENLWMVGGAANSPLWPSILADITGVSIHLPDYDNWPALGAAILAGTGVGLFDGFKEGLQYFSKPSRTIEPNQQTKTIYDQSFFAYQSACSMVRQIPNHPEVRKS